MTTAPSDRPTSDRANWGRTSRHPTARRETTDPKRSPQQHSAQRGITDSSAAATGATNSVIAHSVVTDSAATPSGTSTPTSCSTATGPGTAGSVGAAPRGTGGPGSKTTNSTQAGASPRAENSCWRTTTLRCPSCRRVAGRTTASSRDASGRAAVCRGRQTGTGGPSSTGAWQRVPRVGQPDGTSAGPRWSQTVAQPRSTAFTSPAGTERCSGCHATTCEDRLDGLRTLASIDDGTATRASGRAPRSDPARRRFSRAHAVGGRGSVARERGAPDAGARRARPGRLRRGTDGGKGAARSAGGRRGSDGRPGRRGVGG